MDAVSLTPAIIRTFGRCLTIELEIDEAIGDAEPVEVLLERCDRLRERTEEFKRTGIYDSDDEHDRAKAATRVEMLARHREYQWRKAELGRLLALRPDDINPLDLDVEECADDPRIEIWRRAAELRFRLDRAHLNLILWAPPLQIVGQAVGERKH
jgi:hypothetical protein